MIISIETVLLCLVLPTLYALGGLKEAIDNHEKVNWPIFFKTIFIGLVTAGLLSASLSTILIAIVETPLVIQLLDAILNLLIAVATYVITRVVDADVNALINKNQRTKV